MCTARYMYTELSGADLQDLDWHSLAVRLPDADLQDLDWYLLDFLQALQFEGSAIEKGW